MKRAIDTSKLRVIPVGTKVKIIKASLLQPSYTVGKIAVIKEVVYYGKNKVPAYRVSFLDKRFSTYCKLKGDRNYDWTYAWYELIPANRQERLENIKHHKELKIDKPRLESLVKIIKADSHQPDKTIGKFGKVKQIYYPNTTGEHYKVVLKDGDHWFYGPKEIEIIKY